MSLLRVVAARLRDCGTLFTVIGAVAMAVHGVSRSTRDLDLLVLDPECLTPSYWDPLRQSGVRVTIRRGDADDPLRDAVRLIAEREPPVDVVVGKGAWQADIATRAIEAEIEGATVPVASRADLIMLKLYAGGPQDAWDIIQLLDGPHRMATIDEVERRVPALGAESGGLWRRIRGGA